MCGSSTTIKRREVGGILRLVWLWERVGEAERCSSVRLSKWRSSYEGCRNSSVCDHSLLYISRVEKYWRVEEGVVLIDRFLFLIRCPYDPIAKMIYIGIDTCPCWFCSSHSLFLVPMLSKINISKSPYVVCCYCVVWITHRRTCMVFHLFIYPTTQRWSPLNQLLFIIAKCGSDQFINTICVPKINTLCFVPSHRNIHKV